MGFSALETAFVEIEAAARSYKKDAELSGVLITPMAEPGVELIIGVTRDPQYGRIIMLGLGGVFVEVIRDAVFRSVPIGPADAWEMLDELRYKTMLDGVRGAGPADKAALVDLLVRVSRLSELHDEIAELDLNPVIAHERGYSIVDARALLQRPAKP